MASQRRHAPVVGRAFLRRRHAARGVGWPQKLQAEERYRWRRRARPWHDTQARTTDPDRRLYRKSKGKESNLCYMGHATMENRTGRAVAGLVTQASGTAERTASEERLGKKAAPYIRITVGADKAYDVAEHVERLRAKNLTPPLAGNDSVTKTGTVRKTSIDGRTTRHKGYTVSQGKRTMIECMFGWGKQHGPMRKTKHRGLARVAADFLLNLIGYNLIRIPKLLAQRG